MFGMAAFMGLGGRPTAIDFTKQFALGIVGKATTTATTLLPLKLAKVGKKLVFKYQIKTGTPHPSFTNVPCLVILVNNKYKMDSVAFMGDNVGGK